jgi:hypothetical protein
MELSDLTVWLPSAFGDLKEFPSSSPTLRKELTSKLLPRPIPITRRESVAVGLDPREEMLVPLRSPGNEENEPRFCKSTPESWCGKSMSGW